MLVFEGGTEGVSERVSEQCGGNDKGGGKGGHDTPTWLWSGENCVARRGVEPRVPSDVKVAGQPPFKDDLIQFRI
jgi:hypothetical protein